MKTVIACIATALVVAAASATAASLIRGSQIAHNTIRNRNLHASTITLSKLSPGVRKLIRKVSAQGGTPTPVGASGPAGAPGAPGATGATGAAGGTGAAGTTGPAGQNAINQVTTLSANANVAAPAWAGRVGTDGGTSGPGSVAITPAGATIGPLTDGAQYGSVQFHGLDGARLADLSNVVYTASYTQTGTDAHGGTPYFRIFTTDSHGDAHDIVFSPNTQSVNRDHSGQTDRFEVLGGTVRYDDDAGYCEQGVSWDTILDGTGAVGGTCDGDNGLAGDGHNPVYDTGHADDVITRIVVEAGDGGGYSQNTTAIVNSVTLEAKGHPQARYDFGS